jgi:hypothetical protein
VAQTISAKLNPPPSDEDFLKYFPDFSHTVFHMHDLFGIKVKKKCTKWLKQH